jgi:hypothetical protein
MSGFGVSVKTEMKVENWPAFADSSGSEAALKLIGN